MKQSGETREKLTVEIMLVVLVTGMAYLLYCMGAYKFVVLNLFYMPIVLAGYYLGRARAGVLALFSVLAATIATTLDLTNFTAQASPLIVGLALSVWGAALGLTAILLGTLCDERARILSELHAAYVGVVEVLSKYLQSANPGAKARATRVAELSQEVACEMRRPQREIDDIRVAALLFDLGDIEITTRMLSRAVDTLETAPEAGERHTFTGLDLVHSLGSVLSGALPLLVTQDAGAREILVGDEESALNAVPIGARIIAVTRAYDGYVNGLIGEKPLTSTEAIAEIRKDVAAAYDPDVVTALEQVVCRQNRVRAEEPAYA